MQSITIGANQAGQRLDKFLRKCLPNAQTGFLYKMLRKKNITLNGKKADGSELLAKEDKLCFFFSDDTFAKFSGQSQTADTGFAKTAEYEKAYRLLKGIQVLYEDEHILILDKPAGILTQKATPQDISLNEWMIGYLLENNARLAAELNTFRPSVCNRLDRNTSGIVLCGKSLAGLQLLSRCVRERSIQKYYRTICVGSLREDAAIKGYLLKDTSRNIVHVSPTDKDGGEWIETRYTPLCVKNDYTLLEVELITGKPHQIRAHLASIGHPLVGDAKYGNQEKNRLLAGQFDLHHQLLHACRVVFPQLDDSAGQQIGGKTISSPCPRLFARVETGLMKGH